MEVNTNENLVKNGRQALWMVTALSGLYCFMSIRGVSQADQLVPLLPGLLHFFFYALGFSLLAIASRSGSYKPELIGAVILSITILLTVADSLLGEGLHKNITYLVVRGIFLFMLIKSIRVRKEFMNGQADAASQVPLVSSFSRTPPVF